MLSQHAQTTAKQSIYQFWFYVIEEKGRICATVCDVYENIIKRINEAKFFTKPSPN